MAWRESRSSRVRLLWFSLSISLGVAALVAVGSLSATLRSAIEAQAKGLLGADLVLSARHPFTVEAEAFAKSLNPSAEARETSFSTMLVFPHLTNAIRLVNARALLGDFPFYGKLEVVPESAASSMRQGNGIIIEESILFQFGLKVGDPVRIGAWTTQIAGVLKKVPGDAMNFGTLAPRIYFDASRLEQTRLLGGASLARYRRLFRFDENRDLPSWVRLNQVRLTKMALEADTVERRKETLGEGVGNLNRFLGLVALVALVLGAIGIASALHVHVTSKCPNVAVLRCLGAAVGPASAIYLAQGVVLAAFGTAVGLVIGLLLSPIVPRVVQKFIPVSLTGEFHWAPALVASVTGFLVSAAFTVLPLGSVRGVSPLQVIRADFEPRVGRDYWAWKVGSLIVLALIGFAESQAHHRWEGAAAVVGLGIAFGVLSLVAMGLVRFVRRFTPQWLPFAWRQGLAGLHRPRNRTVLVITSVGLGTFLLVTLQLTRDVLLTQLFPAGNATQPNTILFDIQPDQRDGVVAVLKDEGLAILDEAPIITMRLVSLKGRSTDQILGEKDSKIPSWTLRREYRSTWRTRLVSSEILVAGRFPESSSPLETPIPVTVETGIARNLGLGLGDEIVFDIQGMLMTNRVAGLREVDWKQVRPNFFFVFPAGVLEEAPATYVMGTRVIGSAASAQMQRTVVGHFPNVSVVDLTLVLQTLDGIVTQVALVTQILASFTVMTGLVVMAGAIMTGRWQRMREVVLLRTLGASRRQLRQALFAEYSVLGMLGATTGILLAMVAAWALATFIFHTGFSLRLSVLGIAFAAVTVLTISVGLLSSWGLASQSPLSLLRNEGAQ